MLTTGVYVVARLIAYALNGDPNGADHRQQGTNPKIVCSRSTKHCPVGALHSTTPNPFRHADVTGLKEVFACAIRRVIS